MLGTTKTAIAVIAVFAAHITCAGLPVYAIATFAAWSTDPEVWGPGLRFVAMLMWVPACVFVVGASPLMEATIDHALYARRAEALRRADSGTWKAVNTENGN